jgi:hypothetical protein
VPAASTGQRYYVRQSHFVTSLGNFFTSVNRPFGPSPAGRRLPAAGWNATNEQQGRNEVCLVMAINDDDPLQLIAIADPLRFRLLP